MNKYNVLTIREVFEEHIIIAPNAEEAEIEALRQKHQRKPYNRNSKANGYSDHKSSVEHLMTVNKEDLVNEQQSK